MNLLQYLLKHTSAWIEVFVQQRSLNRGIALAFGILCGVGKRTITRAITFHGNGQKDWSADYKFFSRSPWEANALFHPILQQAIQGHALSRLVIGVDDTRVWRHGKHVPHSQWHRDPLSPPFHTNLRWGHRFLQASLMLPLYQKDGQSSSRSIPVRFEMAPAVRKPGKRATPEQIQEYQRAKKVQNLSVQCVRMIEKLRQHLDGSAHADKAMIVVGDGSFCNRTVFGKDWATQNVVLVTRCRKDIVLCKRASGHKRRFYSKRKFTPEWVRQDDGLVPWKKTQIFHGGCYREVRYKELDKVYWQRGAKKQPLRLWVVAPVGYRLTKKGRQYYRQPAYLLTTNLTTPAQELLQDYFDRWGIEVNHRDEKEILGVGEAQVWNKNSVSKVPALLVAMYSWLLLAGLACYGATRTKEYEPLPKWRRGAKRPSCLDLITLLRRQLTEQSVPFEAGEKPPTCAMMVGTAAA